MSPDLQTVLPIYLAGVNLATFAAFWNDKRRAVLGCWRIAERDLLTLALIGGSPGALCARKLLRHKTRKQPFSTWLWLIATIHAGLAIGWLVPLGA